MPGRQEIGLNDLEKAKELKWGKLSGRSSILLQKAGYSLTRMDMLIQDMVPQR
ncbi:galactokinase [Ruminiclostridium papyrosolvens DSM 2782]|uniref:Galactokinase n=1 Tax=Ruminiclostridium papyrosolvens DSM 2782 TaxID=588581 RepID=F1T8D2_9FIRM|nr:hypothetical protein [Ruminiclostridium papyrosolvens]EGD49730.1 galactokinase [Ruminiclostridium papyrosolvens DSM 2782]WES33143.1 hypothetical protein P0092_15420 [Ruminiclostridium papyrosolvens DSM 2782]